MSFIDISSRSLLFVISLCSVIVPLESSSGSKVSCETPEFLGLYLRERRRQALYFDFSVVISE